MVPFRRFVALALSVVALQAYSQTVASRRETLHSAAALIERGELSNAEAELQSLLKQAPDDPLALNLLGVVRLRQHNGSEAENLFRKAVQSGHRIAGPYINLAMIYAADRPLEAVAELRQALLIAPEDRQAVLLLRQVAKDSAGSAMQRGDKVKAIEVLSKARAVMPRDPELLYDSGFLAYECGSYQEADNWLTEALKIRPDYSDAQYALARTYLAENLAKPAEDEMRKYLAQKPEDATAEYGLGYILMAEERLDEAKIAFEKSVTLQPQQTESVYQLGEIASQKGDDVSAQEDYTKVLARDPRHGGALTGLGVLAYRAGKYDEAKSDLQRAISAAPSYQKAHYYYALALSRLGQKAEAEREFTVAQSLQKLHGGAHHLLAAQP